MKSIERTPGQAPPTKFRNLVTGTGLGFRVWGLGVRVWGLGVRVWGLRV